MDKIKFLLQQYKFYLIVPVVILLVGVYYFTHNKDNEIIEIEEIVEVPTIEENVNVEVEEPVIIKFGVDIKGAVTNPGVYFLDEGSTVKDVIEKAHGLTKEADVSTINLSKKVFDEMVIIIYTKKEVEEMKKGSTTVKVVEKECICPEIKNDACINNNDSTELNSTTNQDKEENINTKVSLNKATQKELETLTGIGASKAKAIIEYRDKNGGFKTIDELKSVSGIGDSTFEKIKDDITI